MTKESFSPGDTYGFGKELGEKAAPGQVYCLDGDLGAGKTVFTQGFAAGLGVSDAVNSPTFVILQEYDDGRIPLYHFDVYRIEDIEEMYEIGCEEFFYGEGVCLVEWASQIGPLLPEESVHIKIERDPERGDDYRLITVGGL